MIPIYLDIFECELDKKELWRFILLRTFPLALVMAIFGILTSSTFIYGFLTSSPGYWFFLGSLIFLIYLPLDQATAVTTVLSFLLVLAM